LYQCKDDINVISELLAVKHGNLTLDLFSNSVLDAFIEFMYYLIFTIFLCLLLLICVYYAQFS